MAYTSLTTLTLLANQMPQLGKKVVTVGFKEATGNNKLQLSMVYGEESPYTPVKPYPAAGAVAGVYVTVDAQNGIETIEGWSFGAQGLMASNNAV